MDFKEFANKLAPPSDCKSLGSCTKRARVERDKDLSRDEQPVVKEKGIWVCCGCGGENNGALDQVHCVHWHTANPLKQSMRVMLKGEQQGFEKGGGFSFEKIRIKGSWIWPRYVKGTENHHRNEFTH